MFCDSSTRSQWFPSPLLRCLPNLTMLHSMKRIGASRQTWPDNYVFQESRRRPSTYDFLVTPLPETIRLLCDYGARINVDELQLNSISLLDDVREQHPPGIASQMNRSFLNRQLRYARAVHSSRNRYQFIKRSRIHSTTLRHSTWQLFPIVHTLLSRGATIWHSNPAESISLVDLTKQYQYKQIAKYLSTELNRQFLTSILNNARKSARC